MSKRIELNIRIAEIARRLEDGDTRKKLVEEYTVKWSVSEHTVDRYLALARDVIAGKMEDEEAAIEAARGDAIAEAIENGLISTLELEARLCAIAMGDTETERVIQTKKGPETIKCKPTARERMIAINMLMRMRGNYDPKVRKAIASRTPIIIQVADEATKERAESTMRQSF
jgi:hypothetical protein